MDSILKKLCLINSVSGHEKNLVDIIISNLPPDCTVTFDNIGNLAIEKNKNMEYRNRIMIISSIDEPGLIINHIEDDGSLRFLTIGNINPDSLVGSVIEINHILGIIGQKPPHLEKNKKSNLSSTENMVIDIGCDSKKQALEKIKLGDVATFKTEFLKYGNNRINSKSINNKISCSVLLKLLQNSTSCNFFCAFLTKSNISCFGATTISNLVQPDIAIIVNSFEENFNLNRSQPHKNFKLTLNPSTNKQLFDIAKNIAQSNNFDFDVEINNKVTELEKSITQTNNGVKTLAISIPCNLINSNCSNFRLDDSKTLFLLLNKLVLELA